MSLVIAKGRQNAPPNEAAQLRAVYEKAIRENKEFSEVRKIYEELKASLKIWEPGKPTQKKESAK
jgi:hypothetical protein